MKSIIIIVAVLIAIGIGLVSYSQMSQDSNVSDVEQNEVKETQEVNIVQNEPKSYSVGLNEKVGFAEP